MAKAKAQSLTAKIERNISRPGIHSKSKTSSLKSSKNYKKAYRGQGR
jgi:hypothetical protein